MSLITKRALAFLIDYCVIVVYALVLFGGVMLLQSLRKTETPELSPLHGQLIGFITLTLPVFLYFFFSEKGTRHGTIGKRVFKIQVTGDNLLLRSILKFMPWELAHAGVLWLFYFERSGIETPIWVWVLLILPQILVLIYIVSILIYRGEQSIYDKIAQTRIQPNVP